MSEVAEFLHRQLNPRLSADDWAAAMVPPWHVEAPNHGFLLRAGGRVVGASLAFYSDRDIAGRRERLCNLAAWCVDEDYRSHGVRLLRALLAQRDMHFTDLSPSGNVVAINERLRFHHLDTTTVIVPNVPRPVRGVRLVSRADEIEELLSGRDAEIFRDHRDAAAAIHVVLESEGRSCYVVARKDRRKDLPLFASLLHVSAPDLLPRVGPRLFGHLLLRHGALATLAELRVVGVAPARSRPLARPRPKMFRSDRLGGEDIDYLYSELTCVAW